MKKVAFICVHNSCRSQIAEALGKHFASDVFEINDEGLAEAKEGNNIIDNMDSELKEDVMDAVEGCPTSAIQIEKND